MPMLKRYNNAPQADIRIAVIEKEPIKNRQPYIFWRVMETTMEIMKSWCEYIDDEDAPFQIFDYNYAGAFLENSGQIVEWQNSKKLPDEVKSNIKRIIITNQISLSNMKNMFRDFSSVEDFVNLTNINGERCLNLEAMFANCLAIKKLDCSSILVNIREQQIKSMFNTCPYLEHIYIDIEKWDYKNYSSTCDDSTFFTAGVAAPETSVVAINYEYNTHYTPKIIDNAFFYKKINNSIIYGCFEPKNFYTVSDSTFKLLLTQLSDKNVFYYYLDHTASEENPDIIVVHPVKDKTLYITTKNKDLTIEDILL